MEISEEYRSSQSRRSGFLGRDVLAAVAAPPGWYLIGKCKREKCGRVEWIRPIALWALQVDSDNEVIVPVAWGPESDGGPILWPFADEIDKEWETAIEYSPSKPMVELCLYADAVDAGTR